MTKRTSSSLLLALSILVASAAAQSTPTLTIGKDNRTIAISATEHVLNDADTAIVHIGFVLYGPTKDAAYKAGSDASNAIAAALKSAGIPHDAIQSETQGLAETQPFLLQQTPAAERPSRAFTVQQSWTVRVQADDGAKVLNLAVAAGANNSGAIDWILHDPSAAQSAAAAKAIQRAREQATAMATGLGVHLGPLLYASNQVEAEPILPLARALNAPMAGVAAEPKIPPLAINPRQIETTATVYAVFALE